MKKYIETTGKNEDEAISAALAALSLDRDDVSVEVIERAKSGFLGIGGSPARVRVSYEVPDEIGAVPVQEDKPRREERSHAPRRDGRNQARREDRRQDAPKAAKKPRPDATQSTVHTPAPSMESTPVSDDDATAAQIRSFIEGLLAHMKINAQVEIGITPEGNYRVVLSGENTGAVIGRRGETLDAIQQITSYSINRTRNNRVRIYVDAENYRAKREAALAKMALRAAEKARRTHRNVTLEPMNAYERHVVHTALQDVAGVSTGSIGTEPNRRVVIQPE